MKPIDIYNLKPIYISYNIEKLKDILSSISDKNELIAFICQKLENIIYNDDAIIEKDKLVQIRTYMDEGNEKYGGILSSLYFNNKPILISKTYGRYYSDNEVYLTNKAILDELLEYLQKITNQIKTEDYSIYPEDEDIQGLETVDGYNLMTYYSTNTTTKYKNNDVVWAWVPENHLLSNYHDNYKGNVLTRVKITDTHPHNPIRTYYGIQIDRAWVRLDNNIIMAYQPNKGTVGCEINDNAILGLVSEIPIPKEAIEHYIDSNGILFESYKNIETLPNSI